MANGICVKTCDCNITINDTGVGCTPIMKVEKRAWIMNETDSAGALNFIDLTVPFSSMME